MPTCTFDNATLPTIVADYCNPETHYGQVQKFHFTKPGQGLTDVTSLVEWNTRLSNSAAASGTPPPIRTFHVIGQVPAPEQAEKEMSLKRKTYTTPKNTFTFRVDETDDENIELARVIQGKGAVTYQAWLETEDLILGGDAGIQGQLKLYYVVPESAEDLMYLEGTFTWEGVQAEGDASPFV